jgi:hypothetical protein
MAAIFNVPKIFEKISIVAMRWLAPGAGFGIMSGRRHRNFPASPSIAGDGVVRKYETGLEPLDARSGAASDVARIRLVLRRGVRRGPCQAHYHRLTQAALRPGCLGARPSATTDFSRSDLTPCAPVPRGPVWNGSGQAFWFTRRSPFTRGWFGWRVHTGGCFLLSRR